MALQQQNLQSVEWKSGSICELFNRDNLKWEEGEIIGSFSDENGKWLKVRCGQSVRDVLAIDPDLRVRKVIQSDQLLKLERAAVQIPNIKPILDNILPSFSGQGVYVFADRESLAFSLTLLRI